MRSSLSSLNNSYLASLPNLEQTISIVSLIGFIRLIDKQPVSTCRLFVDFRLNIGVVLPRTLDLNLVT